MVDFKVIGQSMPKIDALNKVLGKAVYSADRQMEGMLYAQVVRSRAPHALVKSINPQPALKRPGVIAVLTARDIPGPNLMGPVVQDEPVLVSDKARRVGDPLALVIGESEGAAKEAVPFVEVCLEELAAVFDPLEAIGEKAPQVHARGNVANVRRIIRGNIEEAFASAAIVVKGRYRTHFVEHAYIEPETVLAYLEGEILTILTSTQIPYLNRKEVARNLNMGDQQVRIIQAATGGAFGGKLDSAVQCLAGLASFKTGRPVRLSLSREESIQVSTKRHPLIINYESAADREGKLLGVRVKIIADTGAYLSWSPLVVSRAAVHSSGPYQVPHVWIEAVGVYTNNPPAGAMRGFGVPQVAFAHESQMDLLAEKVGISPVQIRLKNALRPGAVTATGQVLGSSVGLCQTLEAAWEKVRDSLGEGGKQS